MSLVCMSLSLAARGGVIYVDADATGASDGSSWADSFTDLQDALAAAAPGDEIWVAEGTYRPTDTADRTIPFQLVEGVALYGGFAGTESAREERDWTAHETILSGDLAGDDDPAYPLDDPARNNGENSYHVVAGARKATLDGFTVTRGNANGSDTDRYGGGMYDGGVRGLTLANCTLSENSGSAMYNRDSSSIVTQCTFSGNSGGAMYNRDSSSTVVHCTFSDNSGGGMYSSGSVVTATSCTFSGNTAEYGGGGIYNFVGSSATVRDCTFSGNTAGWEGGGILNLVSYVTVTASTFSDNAASSAGGGMCNSDFSATVRDCTFSGNTAGYGGGMVSYSHSSPTVTNCRFSGNAAGYDGGGMYNQDSSPSVVNCTFSGNTASSTGGGICSFRSSPTVTNCTFSGNTGGSSGGGIYNYDSSPTVTNCILWADSAPTGPEIYDNPRTDGRCTVSHSDVGQVGGFTGAGNIDADPLFVDPGRWDDNNTPEDDTDDFWVDGDYHLQAGSPCIDAADGSGAPAGDMEGNPRDDDPATPNTGSGTPDCVDMGACEYQSGHPWILLATPFGGGCAPVLAGVAWPGPTPLLPLALAALALGAASVRRRRRA